MKKEFVLINTLVLLMFSANQLWSQCSSISTCPISENSHGVECNKYVNVNVHFMLSEDPDEPYNFTEVDDGQGNSSVNGYMAAEAIINTINNQLSNNQQMWLPNDGVDLSNNTHLVCPTGVRFALNGVYFHRDDDLWYYCPEIDYIDVNGDEVTFTPSCYNGQITCSNGTTHNFTNPILHQCQYEIYGENKGSEINIFFMGYHPEYVFANYVISNGNLPPSRGVGPHNWVKVVGPYINSYIDNGLSGWVASATGILYHELGHSLDLPHTWIGDDGCDDTPENCNCWDQTTSIECNDNPACNLTIPSACEDNDPNTVATPVPCGDFRRSNNVMDYNNQQNALTKCQICRMHQYIMSDGIDFLNACYAPPCKPLMAKMVLPTEACANEPIYLDGHISFGEENYLIEIAEVDAVITNNVISGTTWSQWFNGQTVGRVDLTSLYTFSSDKLYRVRLAVSNSCADVNYDEVIKYVYVLSAQDNLYISGTATNLNDERRAKSKIYGATDASMQQLTYQIDATSSITWVAGDEVILKPGFSTSSGSYFYAYTKPIDCNGGVGSSLKRSYNSTDPLSNSSATSNRFICLNDEIEIGSNATNTNESAVNSSSVLTLENITVYPNPFNNNVEVVIKIPVEADVRVRVSNLQGGEVTSPIESRKLLPGDYKFTINGDNLPSGMYFVEIQVGDKRYTEKIVKVD